MKNNIKTIKYIVFLAFLSMFVFTQINIKTTEASTCGTSCTSCPTTFSATCSSNRSTADIGEEVTWTVNASGGTRAYTYSWSGTESLSGSSKSITGTYDYAGTKTANVTVTSACRKVVAICSMEVVEPVQNLSVSCSANPTRVNVGEELTWSADASGGTGSYTYSWSGTESLYGSYRSITGTYDYTGTKNARVTVRSGNQTASADCTAYVEVQIEEEDDLDVSCYADEDNVEAGDSIKWISEVTGGTGSYRYSWSGTNSLSGTSRTVTKYYSTEGEKTARITVTSGGQSASATCYADVEEEDEEDDLEVSCSSNYDEVETGDSVRFTADADGGTGSYKYSWSGTNSLSGTSRTVTKYYSTEGEKTAKIKVTSGGQTATATCYIDVEDNRVLSYVQNTNPVMPLTSSVYLSDIPYTGAGDNLKIVLFILALGLWGVFLAYYLLKKNISNNVSLSTNIEDLVVSKPNNIKLDNSFKVQDNFTKNIKSDNKDLSDIEDYVRMNKVLLSSSATEKILKLGRLGKAKANEVIKSLSTGEWVAVSDKDIE